MSGILTHPEVSASPPGDFTIDGPTGDLVFTSNDTSDAYFFINDAVPENYTFEFTIKAINLPPNFASVATQHVFFGVADLDGTAVGLFFSDAGLAYSGTIDSAIQPLPDSFGLLTDGNYYVIRIAVSTTTGAVFIYITPLADVALHGHQLKYVMPAIPYSSCPPTTPEGTAIRVRGTVTQPSQIQLDTIRLGTGVIIPSLPPVAEAGSDQAERFCQVVQLDGSASFDPQGSALQYLWRLIDAPLGSMFVFSGVDGTTYPLVIPTGFTNKLYSTSFGGASPIPVSAGDVLLVQGIPYTCVSTGSDITGFYVLIDGEEIPDNLVNQAFKILKQNGISGADTIKPTFFPDVLGFYKFDLQVFDGALYSTPRAVTVVNVLDSPLPRGVIPDLTFMWNYLSDFWSLVEDSGRIETFWSGLAQVAATELYSLWQVEYSKSLRDIQRTFIRRWLHYDLLVREPFVEIGTTRFIFRGVDSNTLLNTATLYSGVLVIDVSFQSSIVINLTNPLVQTPAQLASTIQAILQQADSRWMVTVVPVDGAHSLLRIYAPFGFDISTATTVGIFTIGAQNVPLKGTAGVLTNQMSYKTEISLLGIDIRQNDVLSVEIHDPSGAVYNTAVHIASITDVPTDALRFQRLLLLEPLPLFASSNWQIPCKATSTQVNYYQGLVEKNDIGVFEVVDLVNGSVFYYQTTVVTAVAAETNSVLVDPTAVMPFLTSPALYSVFFWGVYRRTYMPIESLIVDIPYLQRIINTPNENEVLRRNVDFFLDTYRGQPCVRFDPTVWVDVPMGQPLIAVPRLWAEYTYLDNRPTIEANFGIPVDFTLADLAQLPSNVDYLSSVQGLWYAYINGPTLFDIRVGVQILLGLPFAEENGTITEIRADFSPNEGRILVQDTDNTEIVRSYQYPAELELETNPATGLLYVVGDKVVQFAPLVTGVDVRDYIKDPKWFQGYLSQGAFTEIEKYFKFLVRVDSSTFNLSALLFVQSFILQIKPTYTYPLFVVLASLQDTDVSVSDEMDYTAEMNFEMGAVYAVKQTTGMDSADPGPGRLVGGVITPWSGDLSSHYVNAADTDTDADYPTNTFPVFGSGGDDVLVWAGDRPHLSPSQFLSAFCSQVYAGGSPAADGTIFRTGFPAYTGNQYGLGVKYLTDVPAAGLFLGDPAVVSGAQTLNCLEIFVEALYDSSINPNFTIELYLNGVFNQHFGITYTSTTSSTFLFTDYSATFTPITVAMSDQLTAKIVPAGGRCRLFWNNLFLTLGTGTALGVLPADTYTRLAPM